MSTPAIDQTSGDGGLASLLLELSGVFCSDVPDAAERHDDYIGEGLLAAHVAPEHHFGMRRLDAVFPDEGPKNSVEPPDFNPKATRS